MLLSFKEISTLEKCIHKKFHDVIAISCDILVYFPQVHTDYETWQRERGVKERPIVNRKYHFFLSCQLAIS